MNSMTLVKYNKPLEAIGAPGGYPELESACIHFSQRDWDGCCPFLGHTDISNMALSAVVLAGGMEGRDGAGDGGTSQDEKAREKGS